MRLGRFPSFARLGDTGNTEFLGKLAITLGGQSRVGLAPDLISFRCLCATRAESSLCIVRAANDAHRSASAQFGTRMCTWSGLPIEISARPLRYSSKE
jgi:hypothetical protein